jgi:hypothetical protein
MIAHLVHIEDVRRDRAVRHRVHEISARVDGALDRVELACILVRSVAAVEREIDQFGARVRMQARLEAILEAAA